MYVVDHGSIDRGLTDLVDKTHVTHTVVFAVISMCMFCIMNIMTYHLRVIFISEYSGNTFYISLYWSLDKHNCLVFSWTRPLFGWHLSIGGSPIDKPHPEKVIWFMGLIMYIVHTKIFEQTTNDINSEYMIIFVYLHMYPTSLLNHT